MHSRSISAAAFAAAAILLSGVGSGLAQDTGSSRAFRFLMGTQVRIEATGGTAAARQQATEEAFAAVGDVDRIMSDYRDDSELAMVNRNAADRPVRVSDPLFAVIDAALRVSAASGGAFDVTIGPLLVLGGVKNNRPHQPSEAELAALRPRVGYQLVELNRAQQTVHFARHGVAIDLGGIARGFAAEVAAGALRRRNLTGLIDTGSVQFMVGSPLGKQSWTVGVVHPDNQSTLLGSVDVAGGAVATVGTTSASARFDPRSLEPTTAALSATVVAMDATLADALAHAAVVLGPRAGLSLISRFGETWGVIAYRQADGTVGTAVTPQNAGAFHPVR